MITSTLTFQRFSYIGAALLGSLVVAGVAVAWTGPPGAPTTCPSGAIGCDAPINTSATAQGKLGSLGIGTTNPTQKLDVAGNITTSIIYDRDNAAYYLDPNGTSKTGDIYISRSYSPLTGALYFGTSGSKYLFFDSASYTLAGGSLTIPAGRLNAYALANDWAGVFYPNGAYGITVQSNSSGINTQLVNGAYGVLTNGHIYAGGAELRTNGDLYMPWRGTWLSSALPPASSYYFGGAYGTGLYGNCSGGNAGGFLNAVTGTCGCPSGYSVQSIGHTLAYGGQSWGAYGANYICFR